MTEGPDIIIDNIGSLMYILLFAGYPVYLHDLLEDSMLHLPKVEPPPRVSVNVMKLNSITFKYE